MDATYNDVSLQHASNTTASAPYYADPASAAAYQHLTGGAVAAAAAVPGGGEGAPSGYAQSTGYGASGGTTMGTQAHATSSMQNFTSQLSSHSASAADAPQAQGQHVPSAYPYSHDNAYAAQQAPSQSAQGTLYQTEARNGTSADVQALLDSLTPAATSANPGQYAAPYMSTQPAQPQHNVSSLPAAANLPARPPTQEQPATHPNYAPKDDIRSHHPQNQRAPNAQQRGSGALNAQNQEFARMQAQTSNAPGQAQQQQTQRNTTPDDEDQRWPPEVNRRYEEFLEQERKFVTEGQWDQFPMGSRLFIGTPG